MSNFHKHLIQSNKSIREALFQLNKLSSDTILFVTDNEERLVGSLTDGDVRRGLINGFTLEDRVVEIIQQNPKYIRKGDFDIEKVIYYRENLFRIIPIVDSNNRVVNIINFREIRSYLPIDAVIMAGGKGQRLLPLTEDTPKPMLKVGEKPIIEHNIDRLALFGIENFWISINYLGHKIETYFADGTDKNIQLCYVREDQPLGTIGAVSKIDNFQHDYILITNSDLLTNLDYEHFFLSFLIQDADLAIVTIPYQVNIPFAVLETMEGEVINFKEKPTYTYYSNGGIYLLKRSVLDLIPKHDFFNATDLVEKLISEKYKVISYQFFGYWLDIGSHQDFLKAQEDIKQIVF